MSVEEMKDFVRRYVEPWNTGVEDYFVADFVKTDQPVTPKPGG